MIRLRHPTLFGENDRMFSPARDISLIAYPIIKGALDAAYEKRPELRESMNQAARLLAQFCSSAVSDKAALPDLLGILRTELSRAVDDTTRHIVMEELAISFLLNFGIAAREAVDSKVLLDSQIAALTEQGSTLSELDPDDRKTLAKALRKAGLYEKALDRKPIVGKVLTELDSAETDGEVKT